MKTINDFYDDNVSSTLFKELYNFDMPCKEVISYEELDNNYRYIHAYNLICSRITDNLPLTEIAKIIYNTFSENWKKLWENYVVEYNPIENYSMVEELTGKKTTTFDSDVIKEENNTNKITSDVTSNNSSTSNATGSTTTNSDTSIYTFNTQNGTKSDSGVTTSTPNLTNTSEDDNVSNTITNTAIKINSNATTSNNGIEDNTHNLKRSGNIGVTTSAQMIKENLDLWKWNFYNSIFKDIDSIITIGVYAYDRD